VRLPQGQLETVPKSLETVEKLLKHAGFWGSIEAFIAERSGLLRSCFSYLLLPFYCSPVFWGPWLVIRPGFRLSVGFVPGTALIVLCFEQSPPSRTARQRSIDGGVLPVTGACVA